MSLLERCPHFRGWYVQASGPEDVSLLERCPHFRGYVPIREVHVLTSEGVSLLERCPHFRGCVPIREVSSLQRVYPYYRGVLTSEGVSQ